MEIIVKRYEHLNKAFPKWDTKEGVHVKSKDHYDRLMKENNMISYEESIDRSKDNGKKAFAISDKALALIKQAKHSSDSRGRVKLEGRLADGLREIGAIDKKIPHYMQPPAVYSDKGGFSK